MWDGAPIHPGEAVKRSLQGGAARRIHIGRFPGHVPETDVQERIWRHLGFVELSNVCCNDLEEERRALGEACEHLRQEPRIIHSCIVHAGLI